MLLQFLITTAFAQQYYLRGEVRDESGSLLQNVKIAQVRTGFIFRTDAFGSFGISSSQKTDSLQFMLEGYLPEKYFVITGEFISIRLKRIPIQNTNIRKEKLVSLSRNVEKKSVSKLYSHEETYADVVENEFVKTKNISSTGVALNIDRASYSNIRRFINLDMKVPTDAVRIEEMLNNFNFAYQPPFQDSLFKINTTLTACPWNSANQLYYVNINSKKINFDSLPPAHLVFLIDVSGSMDMPNRLPLLKSAFKNLVLQLREKDTVSIVVYGGFAGVMLFPTSGNEKEKIIKAIDDLSPGGSTPGESGVRLAYSLAKNYFIENGNNRIILATDGDFNVGLKTEIELEEMIMRHREKGIYLTCLGVGMGNYKDSKIQLLARKGNGNFAYLDNYYEADKILLKEFAQTLYTVADDVYLNVEFNPSYVKEYRLIGFDNKVSAITDSISVIEGGEIGSGYSVTMAFEIIPEIGWNDFKNQNDFFSEINLHYQIPNDSIRQKMEFKSNYNPIGFNKLTPNYRFANSVIMFGSLLKSSAYTKNITWGDVLFQASEAANPTDINQSQFVELVYKAKLLYGKFKKKKETK